MRIHRERTRCLHLLFCTAWVAAVLLFAGCRAATNTGDAAPSVPGSATPGAGSAVAAEATPSPPLSQDQQLVVWLSDDLNTAPDTSAGEQFEQAIRAFEQAHPGVSVEWQLKSATGQNGLLAVLESAHQVAPSILPDVVLLDSRALGQLADLGLVVPVSAGLLHSSADGDLADFYPFALDAVLDHGAQLGVPYAADVRHLAYLADGMSQTPATWQELIERQVTYLFPVAGQDGTDSILLQYVGAGGQLLEDGSINDAAALQALMAALDQARQAGVIPATIQDQVSMESVWAIFSEDETRIAEVSANAFRGQHDANSALGYGNVPTVQGRPTTVARTWALAVMAADPERRSLAEEFIQHMLSAKVQGSWSQSANRLPTRRTAFESWSSQGDYHEFIGQQLETAVALPGEAAFADFARRLRDVQLAVLRGEMTPDQAVLAMGTAP